ncbi:MAG TPA: transglutaminase-like domain-containing protein [Candidatus Nitrosocosmicus sp.]|nr:transglutaminase-like domain-containing protein [Candidatus Nitrosocosmicus sp.]
MLNFFDLANNGLPYPITKDILVLYKQVSRQYLDKGTLDSVRMLVPVKIKDEFDEALSENADLMLPMTLLLNWFKQDFMKWMDKIPMCPRCNLSMTSRSIKGNSWIVRSVEYHTCPQCSFTLVFPRYGEIENIAFNRIGRCSEWSFLFGAILCSLSIQSRIVHDFLDHCWNEALIGGKWIHVDSTLQYPISIDNPHYYEKNWNKKYRYVIAFSDNEITDVTKDYSYNWKMVLEQRKKRKDRDMSRIIDYYKKI